MWLRSRNGGTAAGGPGGDDASVLQAQRCELCREKLVFRAKYRDGAPTQLHFSEVNDVCFSAESLGFRVERTEFNVGKLKFIVLYTN